MRSLHASTSALIKGAAPWWHQILAKRLNDVFRAALRRAAINTNRGPPQLSGTSHCFLNVHWGTPVAAASIHESLDIGVAVRPRNSSEPRQLIDSQAS